MNIASRLKLIITVLVGTLAVDQLTKYIAKATLTLYQANNYLGGLFRLQLTHNDGAFLSLGSTLPDDLRHKLLLIGVGSFLLLLLLYTLFNKTANGQLVVALSLVFSGGLSNLLDRAVYGGYVVDFLNLGFGDVRTGVFNVADIAILGGAIMLLMVGFNGKPKLAKN